MNEDGSRQVDEAVIRRIAGGDHGALGALYDLHGRTVYTLALRIVGDPAEAEEVVQDVFLQVWRAAARYDQGRASVAGWLLMMARSRAIDRVRARQARPTGVAAGEFALAGLADGATGQEARVISSQAAEQLKAALQDLPASMRAAIELAYYDGLTQSAIAERLGEPLGTVKTRMRTALQKLRSALGQEGTP
jgi:RNA polymerase sigma-70 factor (ECF subfamily)